MRREQILNNSFSFSTISFINNIIENNSRTIRCLFYHVIIDVLIVIANLLIVASIS